MKADYTTPYGTWHVTTDGDCEGKSTRDLGFHVGFLDEIALALADKAMYDLKFKKVTANKHKKQPSRGQVHVSLDIESGTWGLSDQRVEFAKKLLRGRPVSVEESNYYAAFLISKATPATQQKNEDNLARERALAKLTSDDRKALGLS